MIIPGANRRTVRFKLPHSSLYLVPSLIILVLISFFLTIYWMDFHFAKETSSMKQSLDGQERQLTDQIVVKESELEKLQTNLIDITQQADEFKAKLEEIKKLKNVMELMGQAGGTTMKESKTTAQNSEAVPAFTSHIGGSEVPVSSEQMSQLVTGTKQGLTVLVNDINDLLANLTESESQLIEAERIRNITPTLWPVASHRITSGFGVRLDPFTNKPSMHTGLDIDGALNDPVYATAAGKIVLVGFDSSHGNNIRIDHGRGLQTAYLHLNKMLVKVGDMVTKGQKIGLMGTTGRSTGTHLHYEVIRNTVQIDPSPYLLTNRKDE
jgi:murein DD-endopeptidase MepM/ murein hydrolase activator NlpD